VGPSLAPECREPMRRETPDADAYLLWANYLLTGLLFKGTVDVSYKFRFGPWRTQCRRNDAAMAE
jgi:hypothetical protein